MYKRFPLIFFIAFLAANIIGDRLDIRWLEYLSKPLIIISLVFYFLVQAANSSSVLKKWILGALFFSWVGDVLLLFQQNDQLFFLTGLSAFLVAHIFYIIFFHRVKTGEHVRSNFWPLLIVVIYYLSLIGFLSPYLGEMKLPVRIYGIVISIMLMLAMHMIFIKNKFAGQLMMTGAALFVVSDSVLAINKFYRSFELAGLVIMLSYGMAQLLITEGAIQYIRSRNEN